MVLAERRGKILVFSLVGVPLSISQNATWAVNLLYCRSPSTCKDYSCLGNVQENFLRHVMEVPKSTLTSGLFLEMGILPVQFVIEVRQLMFLKKVIARDPSDPVKKVYLEMLKYPGENNWASNVLDLRCKYNLSQKDEKVFNLIWPDWKIMVKNQVKRSAFLTLFEKCLTNKKTKHLWYSKLGIQPYITSLDPATARSVFKARLNMYEIKANFKKMYDSDI